MDRIWWREFCSHGVTWITSVGWLPIVVPASGSFHLVHFTLSTISIGGNTFTNVLQLHQSVVKKTRKKKKGLVWFHQRQHHPKDKIRVSAGWTATTNPCWAPTCGTATAQLGQSPRTLILTTHKWLDAPVPKYSVSLLNSFEYCHHLKHSFFFFFFF